MLHPGLIVGIVDHFPTDKIDHILTCFAKQYTPAPIFSDREKQELVSNVPASYFARFCTMFDAVFLGVYVNTKRVKYFPVAVVFWPYKKAIIEIPICKLTRLSPLDEV